MYLYLALINFFYIKKFIDYNKKHFIKFKKKEKILIEISNISQYILSSSYLSRVLCKSRNAQLIGYYPHLTINLRFIIIFIYDLIYPFSKRYIFKSFGVSRFLIPLPIYSKKKIEKKLKSLKNKIKNKDDILKIKIDNIYIGDLIYDSYLRINFRPTIIIDSKSFNNHLICFINKFYFWKNYFISNNVRAIIFSHAVYHLGLPARLASYYKIPGYMPSCTGIKKFSKDLLYHDNGKVNKFFFDNLNALSKKKILTTSSKLLNKKFNNKFNNKFYTELYQGNVDPIDIKSIDTFSPMKNRNIFPKNGKLNFVIFAHCFYDAAHNGGKFLFADFYEWLNFLGRISLKTDYNWFIKPHPHSLKRSLNIKILNYFVKKYPAFKLLSSSINNNDIIKSGVNCILSVDGSVGYEFSYLKIPVILASNNSIYENFNFSYQPRTLTEYRTAILNFNNLKFNYSKKEIIKFYASTYMLIWNFFDNVDIFIETLKSHNSPTLFKYWFKNFTKDKDLKRINDIKFFIESEKIKLISL